MRQKVRGGPERVADGEAEVAQRGFVGVDAQDFGGSRGALQRQAGAQRAGGGRVGAQGRVEQSEPGAGGKQRIALPCPSARPAPRPGSAAGGGKVLLFRGFRRARLGSRARRERRRNAVLRVWRQIGKQVEIGANHRGMVNSCGGALSRCVARNPPRLW